MSSDNIQSIIEQFTQSTFRTLFFAEKDSVELNDAIENYVQMFRDNPDMKFNRVTQFCGQYVQTLCKDDEHAFPVKYMMVPLRMTQILRNYLTKRKQYNLEYISDNLPGFLESFLTQKENKEKKRKRSEQQPESSVTGDDLADAFASELMEDFPAPVVAAQEEEATAPPPEPVSKKKRKTASSAAPTVEEPRKISTAVIPPASREEQQSIVDTMEELLTQPPAGSPRSFSSSSFASATSVAPSPPYPENDHQPESILTKIKDPIHAIDSCLFMLQNSVFLEQIMNEEVTIVSNLVYQMLISVRNFLEKKTLKPCTR